MWAYIKSFFVTEEVPKPPPVPIVCARFPADGSLPHLLQLTTTSESVESGPTCFLFHIPDVRRFWKIQKAWEYRDVQRTELQNQPYASCNGVYMTFYSFALDDLPQNINVPDSFSPMGTMWGDVFVAKLAPEEWGVNGWATYEDVPSEFLRLPCVDGARSPYQPYSVSSVSWY